MKSNIELKFLTPTELKNAKDLDWRYEHVSDDNFGFADVKKNRIFVRAGLDSDLTKYLIDHELAHLFELDGTHEDEHGIRHKGGFWKVAIPIITAIAGTALGGWGIPAAAGMLGVGGLGGAVGAGLGAGIGSFGGSTVGQVATGQKPDWIGNAIGAAGAGVGGGIGKAMAGPSGWGGTGFWGSKIGSGLAGAGAGLATSSALGFGRDLIAPRMSGYGGQVGQGQFLTGRSSGQPPLPRPSYRWGQEASMGGDKGTGGRGGMDLPGGKGLQQIGIEMGGKDTLKMSGQGAMDKAFSKQSYDPSNQVGFKPGALHF